MQIPKLKYNESKKKIIIFSGAGLSAPSGISTFRDSNGLWENHDIEQICNERTWKHNFDLVHDFYNQRRVQLNDVKPNIAHSKISDIIRKYGNGNVFNITQNVDNLFERTGGEALHVHGDLTKMKCEACGNNWSIGHDAFDTSLDRCPKCNSLKAVRPDIVFFGGQAPNYRDMFNAFEYANHKDSIFVIIGTMGNVVNVQSLLQGTACKKILCNMEESEYINADLFDSVYYESIETAIDKIENDIIKFWGH